MGLVIPVSHYVVDTLPSLSMLWYMLDQQGRRARVQSESLGIL